MFLEKFTHLAKSNPRSIVLPEGTDARILTAAVHCAEQGITKVCVLGNSAIIKEQARQLSLNLSKVQLIDPTTDARTEPYAQMLYDLRKPKGLSEGDAKAMALQPLVYACCMVRAGNADGCVAGAAHATSDVVRSALQIIGVAPNTQLVSSFFIMQLADKTKPIVFADCALNIAPNAEQLADIAVSSAHSAQKLLGIKPRLAMLSFSSNGSATHPEVDKVRDATALVKKINPQLSVIGDVQFDAAFSRQTLAKKWPDSGFDESANVYIFPSLEAGNIGYKIAERIGGALPVGPVLQGLNKPVNDLSRGCDIDAVISTITVTAVQAA